MSESRADKCGSDRQICAKIRKRNRRFIFVRLRARKYELKRVHANILQARSVVRHRAARVHFRLFPFRRFDRAR